MMKRIAILFACVMTMMISTVANAECQKKNGEWREKMMSEKIAFLTAEIGLSPEEAQTFWPVYNQIMSERDKAMKATFKAYSELQAAVEEGKTGRELKKYTDSYIEAQKKHRQIDDESPERFRNVLSEEKVARLFLAEEKFRRQQIHKFSEKR